MITDITEIKKVVTLFEERNVKFYHACQLKDFKSYLKIGGVPSRNLLEKKNLPFTNFETDNIDRKNQVWNKIFGNLSDFGIPYAFGNIHEKKAPTPNPFGPILLVFNPNIFYESNDIAICLRSAGGRNFDRQTEALPNARSINKLFKYENITDARDDLAKSYIKFSKELADTFNSKDVHSPEVSCNNSLEFLSFKTLQHIIVDPYTINGNRLISNVIELSKSSKYNFKIYPRKYKPGENRFEIKQELANYQINQSINLDQLLTEDSISSDLRNYLTRLKIGNMHFFYDRFSKYIHEGTLIELQNINI